MTTCFIEATDRLSIPLVLVSKDNLDAWFETQPASVSQWLKTSDFKAKPYTYCLIPDEAGHIKMVVIGIKHAEDPWGLGFCAAKLPAGVYHIAEIFGESLSAKHKQRLSLSWILGAYHFDVYREKKERHLATLLVPKEVDMAALEAMQASYTLVRDLINLPAEDANPAELAKRSLNIAKEFKASSAHEITGDTLLKKNLGAIHAVGRASIHAPRLVEFMWGEVSHPRLVLVGKGVSFDSGGLDLKTASGMALMKKDMGGAALALGLARLIMHHRLPVHLHVLLPLVENAVSNNSYRPGDVIKMHKGLTVEVSNTDAEGRLILADALSYAHGQGKADLIMDFATLTGAARVAVGTEVPAFFTPDESIASQLMAASESTQEMLWRLPLYEGYENYLESPIADLKNASSESYAGAITAALFLQHFVSPDTPWLHIDFMGWNVRTRPGRPEGGEAQGLQALFHFVSERYAG
ncbi:MAG: pepB [Gammaproteobacteria bacterium]|jgi:leucyl aminopeptidase|nr:pepB [Gammaproteobacteria bacterium]